MVARRRRTPATAALVGTVLTLLAFPIVRAMGDGEEYRWSVVAVTQPPATMHPGQKTVLAVLARNDGSASWYADDAATLAAAPPVRFAALPDGRASAFASEDPTWLWSGGKRVRMSTPVVPPGGVGAFVFTFTAPVSPSYPVDYSESFGPLVEGAGAVAGPSVTFTTRVRPQSSNVPPIPNPPVPAPPCDLLTNCLPPPPCEVPGGCVPTPPPPPCEPVQGCLPGPEPAPDYKYSLVAATQPPAQMHPGMKTTITAVLRNDGDQVWHADGFRAAEQPAVRLAATPLGRSSAFARDDPTWLWSGGTRVRMATPRVEPGGTGVFSFTFTAPVLGSYPADFEERFAGIAEGAGHMDGPEVTFTTRVRPVSSNLPALPDQPLPSPPCDAPVGCLPTPPPPPCEPVEGCLPTPIPTLPCDPSDPASCSPTPLPTPPCDSLTDCLPPPPCDPGDPSSCLPAVPDAPCSPAGDPVYRDALPPAAAGVYAGSGTPVTGAGLDDPNAVAIDGLSKIVIADTAHHRVLRMDAAGNVLFSWGGPGASSGKFSSPAGVAASTTAIFVADTGNDRIQVFSLGGTYIRQFGGTGGALGALSAPRGISVIATGPFTGSLAVADTGNDRVQILSPTGEPLGVVGTGELASPSAVSVYGNEIYVADTGNDRIVRYTLGGQTRGVFGGPGAGLGCLEAPGGVVANEYGVFVSDTGNDRLQRFSRTGVLLEAWGGAGNDANRLRSPAGVVVDPLGVLWVAEAGNDRLQRFRPSTAAAPPVPCGADPFVCLPSSSARGTQYAECVDLKPRLC